MKQMKEKLDYLANKFSVVPVCKSLFSDDRFWRYPASSCEGKHHHRPHGLAEHTLEVAELCLATNALFQDTAKHVDEKQLFLAAVFHDAGKMWDYDITNNPRHRRDIHHISRSALIWHDAVKTAQSECPWLVQKFEDEVLHAILAHHGRREWGSPVSPNSRLAWLLHLCDGISARMDDCRPHLGGLINDR